jgi:hypothetical protein
VPDGRGVTTRSRRGRLRRSRAGDPGLTRRRAGRGWVYLDTEGARITDPEVVARCNALAVPPAWTEVWIRPWPNGHLQAVGTDEAGRRQYRYHEQWRRDRDAEKHDRVLEVAARLPDAGSPPTWPGTGCRGSECSTTPRRPGSSAPSSAAATTPRTSRPGGTAAAAVREAIERAVLDLLTLPPERGPAGPAAAGGAPAGWPPPDGRVRTRPRPRWR